jgi:sigma-B regulation protein RsbU (phosphoserine phosphatase)
MTLTKGLFKAQAANHDSPREVLIKLNRLFFENAKRGVFISMIYCIFDLDKKIMTFARAGHNPVILHRSLEATAEEVCPPGIAIGLEQNDVFSLTIQEREIPLRSHDIFMLYTDGLNEAQNLRQESFGEERILGILKKSARQPAATIVKEIKKQAGLFAGEAEQFDDMTAVLIKIDL